MILEFWLHLMWTRLHWKNKRKPLNGLLLDYLRSIKVILKPAGPVASSGWLVRFCRTRHLALPILNIVVPQTSQTALVAGFPFFIVTSLCSFPSLLARHLTQYILIYTSPPFVKAKIVRIFSYSHSCASHAKYSTTSKAKMRLARIKLFTIARLIVPKFSISSV